MKSHNVTKSAMLVGLLLGATALENADDFAENMNAVGNVASEAICMVADMTGGIVNLPGGSCTAAPADPNSSGIGG